MLHGCTHIECIIKFRYDLDDIKIQRNGGKKTLHMFISVPNTKATEYYICRCKGDCVAPCRGHKAGLKCSAACQHVLVKHAAIA